MKKIPFTALCISIAILTIILTISLIFATNIYSPGDLYKDHQGIKNCRQCHMPFEGAASRLCIACHTIDTLSQLPYNKQLSDLHISSANKDCMNCHTEHKGIEGKVSKSLNHKNLALNILDACAACHLSDYQKAHPGKDNMDCKICHISTARWRINSFNHITILGKKTNCINCHPMPKDKKHLRYPETCEACHLIKKWEKVHFNHGAFISKQTCIECHTRRKDNLHMAASEDCKSCHSTRKWKLETFNRDKL